ncbi:MAG: co-chaperone GroES [Spirochaetes bacterium]|nr:co-chaperone GroES [Spirochaetota bacterium]
MRLSPLSDRVVLKYEETEEKTQSGIILPDSAKEKPQVAVVVAVGPGKDEEMQVKEGDKVIFSEYSGTEVKLDDETYLIIHQDEVLGILG